MEMANITEIRQNASKIIQRVINKKEPLVILQRSKPVAYIIEATVFEDMKNRLEAVKKYEKMEKTKAAMQKLIK